jgi:hypothetical protein
MKKVTYEIPESIPYTSLNGNYIVVAKTKNNIYKLNYMYNTKDEECAWFSLENGNELGLGTHTAYTQAIKSMLDYGADVSVVDNPLELAEWIEKNYKHLFNPGF